MQRAVFYVSLSLFISADSGAPQENTSVVPRFSLRMGTATPDRARSCRSARRSSVRKPAWMPGTDVPAPPTPTPSSTVSAKPISTAPAYLISCHILLMPSQGPVYFDNDYKVDCARSYALSCSRADEDAQPGYYRMRLNKYRITVDTDGVRTHRYVAVHLSAQGPHAHPRSMRQVTPEQATRRRRPRLAVSGRLRFSIFLLAVLIPS